MPATAVPPVVDKEVPQWKSPNELIHERINFDDTIWGFGLAGGAYYKTPLRITYVKPGSRAQMAHIYPGDIVLKINGIDSSTLTLEKAHEMILESGIHLKINVTSPEDLEDNYFCYQDPLVAAMEELKAKEIKYTATQRHPKVLGKSSHWSLQWPWKTKRKTIYKESNCYLVPSKFEEKHKDTRKPEVKQDDMIVLDSIHNTKGRKNVAGKNLNKNKVTDLEDIKEDLSKENVDVEDIDEGTNQNNSVDNKEVNIVEDNSSVVNSEEVTEQISSIDKNDELGAIEQNSSVKINVEEVEAAQNTSVVENNEINTEEQNSSVDKNENDIVAEPNNTSDKIDDKIDTEQNNIIDKIAENSVPEQDSSVDKNNQDILAEENSSEVKNDEQSIEAIASDATKANEDNVKFENSDIPGMTESEKLIQNTR